MNALSFIQIKKNFYQILPVEILKKFGKDQREEVLPFKHRRNGRK